MARRDSGFYTLRTHIVSKVSLLLGICWTLPAAQFTPAPQRFSQEISVRFDDASGAPTGAVQLIECEPEHVRAFAAGQWHEWRQDGWHPVPRLDEEPSTFLLPARDGRRISVPVPASEVRQILRGGGTNRVITARTGFIVREEGEEKATALRWPDEVAARQAAISPDGILHLAGTRGLFALHHGEWSKVRVLDPHGRDWTAGEVLGVGFDSGGGMWFATKAGVGCKNAGTTRFFEGKDGLPWNDFTGIFPGRNGEVWFTTHLGVVWFDGQQFHYRQGPRWLPHDDVVSAAVDSKGDPWFATTKGLGRIERRSMTLAAKADFYEAEIERYIKRTPFGFVSDSPLRKPGDKASAQPNDNDNDGLWTCMYGAGECFAYAATGNSDAKARAKQAFEAMRFLQKVTQGCEHAPPKGYIARTVRPVDQPDPNKGRIDDDRRRAREDALWKVYEPRWPKSADGKWYWKSDTSSDELDGHYFFYPLYYDLCADTEAEKERVREVVRDITDHLVQHGFVLMDHDGKPTRWGIYDPQRLNHDPFWWQERGLKSLSILSYLAVAEHVTGDPKYAEVSRRLIDRDAYAHNLMHPKVQSGPGSGNQSDDEMAFMCYYGLLRYSKDEGLKELVRISFYRYWLNEAPERNPFFNFAYAALSMSAAASNPWGSFSVAPWPGWHEDAITTLKGFPLDRLNWPCRNSHRLDVRTLSRFAAGEYDEPGKAMSKGALVSDKVLPVENRHFNHWNTDPWQLDYSGDGGNLGPGTVFLLPYYMGLYHGFIEKP